MGLPRIYVISLADYNAGHWLGCWIDTNKDENCVHAEIKALLAKSLLPSPEGLVIHHYEGFGDLCLDKHTDIGTIVAFSNLQWEYGRVFPKLVEYLGGITHVPEAQRYMCEAYYGEYHSMREFAETLLTDRYGGTLRKLPDFVLPHIDYEGIANDLELGGEIFTLIANHNYHVFHSHI